MMTMEILHEGDGWGIPYALPAAGALLVLRSHGEKWKPYIWRNGRLVFGAVRDGQAEITAKSDWNAAILVWPAGSVLPYLYDPKDDTLTDANPDEGAIIAMANHGDYRVTVLRGPDGSVYTLRNPDLLKTITLPDRFRPCAVTDDGEVVGDDVARGVPAIFRDDNLVSFFSLDGYSAVGYSSTDDFVLADGTNERVALIDVTDVQYETWNKDAVNSINTITARVDRCDLIMPAVPIKGDFPDVREQTCSVLSILIGGIAQFDINTELGLRPLTHGSRRVLDVSAEINGVRLGIVYENGVQVGLAALRNG